MNFHPLPPTAKKLLFRAIACLLPVLALICIEISLRLTYPSLQTKADKLRFLEKEDHHRRYSILKISDPDLLWKLKPYSPLMNHERLNRHGFRTPNFVLKKPDESYRIVIIGDSRAFGFGIANRSYIFSDLLRNRLNAIKNHPFTKIETINLAVIGYSSYQGKKLFDTFVRKLDPDLLICWFGFNDTLFYHITDTQSAKNFRYLKMISPLISKLHIYHFFRETIQHFATSQDKPIPIDQPITRRVPIKEYKKNLLKITLEAKKNNCDIIYLNSPIRANIPMILNAKRIEFQGKDGQRYQKLQNQYDLEGYWLMNATRFPDTEKELDRLLIKYPNLPILHFFKAQFFEIRGDLDHAKIHFEKAEHLDTQRKVINQYNDILHEVCAISKSDSVDLVKVFNQSEKQNLFVDDCHPSVDGHELIAETLYPFLIEKIISVKD